MIKMKKSIRMDIDQMRDLLICMRTANGLKQVDMANKIGSTPATISRYESGMRETSLMTILYLYALRPDLFHGVMRALEDDLYGLPKDEEDWDG